MDPGQPARDGAAEGLASFGERAVNPLISALDNTDWHGVSPGRSFSLRRTRIWGQLPLPGYRSSGSWSHSGDPVATGRYRNVSGPGVWKSFADPLFREVLTHLVDNSLRHGGNLKKLS